MNKYKITIRQLKSRGQYSEYATIYEQKVEADETLVPAIMQRVLDYMSVKTNTPLTVDGFMAAQEAAATAAYAEKIRKEARQ